MLFRSCTDGRSPSFWPMIAPNFKDTKLRLGTIVNGTATFPVCFEVGVSKIFPTVKSLIQAAGLEYKFRNVVDGYVYLDASLSIGKGSALEPVAAYIVGKNAEISIDRIDGMGELQALLGTGAGAGMTQQSAASIDFGSKGVFKEGLYQAGGLFGTMLATATAKVFADCQDPIVYKVRAIDQDWSQSCGNWVQIVRPGYMPVVSRVKHISQKPGGDMLLEVGQRLRTIQELLKAGEEVQNILSSFYGSHTRNSWSWGLPETNLDSYEAITHQFLLASTDDSVKPSDDKTIGSGEIDPAFPVQVLLNLKIGWFTSSTYSSTVPTDSHGGVGNHGGYGGGQTSARTQDAHNVPQFTGIAGSPSQYIGTGVYVGLAGGHSHGVSAQGYYTGSGGSPAHSHVYYYPSVNSVGDHQHSVGYATGVQVASSGQIGRAHV